MQHMLRAPARESEAISYEYTACDAPAQASEAISYEYSACDTPAQASEAISYEYSACDTPAQASEAISCEWSTHCARLHKRAKQSAVNATYATRVCHKKK